jgi:hypothetical protein
MSAMTVRVALWLPCALLFSVACVVPAVKPEPNLATPPASEPRQGEPDVLTGHVYDAETGRPLSRELVLVEGMDTGSNVDTDGTYAIRGPLAPGRYTLVAICVGYNDQRGLALVEPGQTCVVDLRLKKTHYNSGPPEPDRKHP